jgi:hypothetical protein
MIKMEIGNLDHENDFYAEPKELTLRRLLDKIEDLIRNGRQT